MLVICFTFRIIIYDYDNSDSEACKYFPLIGETLRFVFDGILQLILSFVGLFLHIILVIFFLIFAILRYTIRSIYDCFMLLLVKCLGRVPASDTAIAWRVQGPGLAFQYYTSIELKDIMLLVAAELEKHELNHYTDLMNTKIRAPIEEYRNFVQKLLNPIKANLNYDEPAQLKEICNKLSSNLEIRLKNRHGIYPKHPQKVRLTREEMDVCKKKIKELVENNVKSKNLNFIWKKYDIREGDYMKLTDRILSEIFGSEFMDPIEDIENR
jgi:hypothetical protein